MSSAIFSNLVDERHHVKLGELGFIRELYRRCLMETFCGTVPKLAAISQSSYNVLSILYLLCIKQRILYLIP
jgi:hypothetical protein